MKVVIMSIIKVTDLVWTVRAMVLTELDVPSLIELKCRGVFIEFGFGADPAGHFRVGQEMELNELESA